MRQRRESTVPSTPLPALSRTTTEGRLPARRGEATVSTSLDTRYSAFRTCGLREVRRVGPPSLCSAPLSGLFYRHATTVHPPEGSVSGALSEPNPGPSSPVQSHPTRRRDAHPGQSRDGVGLGTWLYAPDGAEPLPARPCSQRLVRGAISRPRNTGYRAGPTCRLSTPPDRDRLASALLRTSVHVPRVTAWDRDGLKQSLSSLR